MPHPMRLVEIARHRNGVGGEPFTVVRFTMREDGTSRNMVAILFDLDEPKRGRKRQTWNGRVAVLDENETAAGNIAFAMGNSWRGDYYEPTLRAWIAEDDAKQAAKWDAEAKSYASSR